MRRRRCARSLPISWPRRRHAHVPLEVMGRGSKREVGRSGAVGAVISTEQPGRHHALRAERTRAVGARRHAARRDRGRCSPSAVRCSPSSRSISAPCLARHPGKPRSAACSQPTSPAAGASMSGAARDHLLGVTSGQRAGRAVQVRRSRDEERHRLRPRARPGGLLGHARGDDRGCHQGASRSRRRRARCSASGCPTQTAVEVMCLAHGTPFEVSGSVHLHARSPPSASPTRTSARAERLGHRHQGREFPGRRALSRNRPAQDARRPTARRSSSTLRGAAPFWDEMQHLAHVCRRRGPPLWRISTDPFQRREARRHHRPQDRRAARSTTGLAG